jgi:hypothetical protein
MKKIFIILFLFNSAIAQQGARMQYWSMNISGCPAGKSTYSGICLDTSTIKFVQAIVNSGTTPSNSNMLLLDTLVCDLKGLLSDSNAIHPYPGSTNFWSNIIFAHPIYGSTDVSHAFNLKDTSKHKITYAGSTKPYHSSLGIFYNGTSAESDIAYPTSSELSSIQSATLGYYTRTDTLESNVAGRAMIMSYSGSATNIVYMVGNRSTLLGGGIGSDNTNLYNQSSALAGFYLTSRTTSTLSKTWVSNTLYSTDTHNNGSSTVPTSTFNMGRTAAGAYDIQSTQFVIFLNTGISDSDERLLYKIIQSYQERLGRSKGTKILPFGN